jgi:hypothetical protein
MSKIGKVMLATFLLLVGITVGGMAAVIEDDFNDPDYSKSIWEPVGESVVEFNKGYVLIREAEPGKSFNSIRTTQTFKNVVVEVELRFPRQNLNHDNHAGLIIAPVEGGEKWVFIRRFHRFFCYIDFGIEPLAEVWPIKEIDFMKQEWQTIKAVIKDGKVTIYLNGQDGGTYEIGDIEYQIGLYSSQIDAEFRRVRIEEL